VGVGVKITIYRRGAGPGKGGTPKNKGYPHAPPYGYVVSRGFLLTSVIGHDQRFARESRNTFAPTTNDVRNTLKKHAGQQLATNCFLFVLLSY
jgi:hypothetical protein